MFCRNCGKQIPDDALVCDGCGTPVEVEGAPEPVQEPAPEPVGTAPEQAGAGTVATAEAPTKKRRGGAGLVVLGLAAVLVIGVVILAVKLLPGLLGGGNKAQVVYLNDDYELMYLSDLKEKTEALEIEDDMEGADAAVQFSPDGKKVYFRDGDGSLLVTSASQLKKDEKPERISRNVSSFRVLENGNVFYSQYDSGKYKLQLFDGKESHKLASGMDEYTLNTAKNAVYYTETESKEISLYKVELKKDAERQRLLKGASRIFSAYDADILIYGVDDGGDSFGNNRYTVYSCAPGGEKNKLVSDVHSVISKAASTKGQANFYYYVADHKNVPLYDLVNDPQAAEDARILQEKAPESPSWYDYYPEDVYVEGKSVYYTDRRGQSYPLDVSELLEPGETVDDLGYYEVFDLAYSAADKLYDEEKNDYKDKREKWNAAKEREYLREDLKSQEYETITYDLYHYNGSSERIAAGLSDTAISRLCGDDRILLYQKADQVSTEKVAELSELNYSGEIYNYLYNGTSGSGVWYQNVGGKESELDVEVGTSINDMWVLNDKEVILEIYDGAEALVVCSVEKEALGSAVTLTEDKFTAACCIKDSGDKDIFYVLDDVAYDGKSNVSCGDLCVYKDGKLETLKKDVYGAYVLPGRGEIYVVTEVEYNNSYDREMDIALLKDGKTETAIKEIRGTPKFMDDGQILYLSDGDLYQWNKKEKRRVARDVLTFWAPGTEWTLVM